MIGNQPILIGNKEKTTQESGITGVWAVILCNNEICHYIFM